MISLSTTTSSDGERIILSLWNGQVSTSVSLYPHEAEQVISELRKQLAQLAKERS